MKENIEEDIIKKFENPQYVDLITLIRQFKKEGLENLIVLRKNNLDNILSDYKRVLKENELAKEVLKKQCDIADERNQLLKENEELKYKYDKALSDLVNTEKGTISKQKIKDKIEFIEKEGYWLFLTDRDSDKCVEVLQDLLEEKGE